MEPNALIVLAAGLAAGAVHAASGPDHLAGVAPFAAREGRRAWRVGAAWGLGHALGALAGAAVALALRSAIPGFEESLSSVTERVVGVLLCLVGAFGLHVTLRRRALPPPKHVHAPFALGGLHGIAGLSHLFAVLPALALPGTLLPALYLAGYALACLATLTVFATLLGRWIGGPERPERLRVGVLCASAASLAVGLFWIVRPI